MTASLLEQRTIDDRTGRAVERLRGATSGSAWGRLEWTWPTPSAAFSRRDSREPGFTEAMSTAIERGYHPFIRPVGGRYVAYDDQWLVLDLYARCDEPRSGTTARFRAMGDILARGLRTLDVDARVGAVPGEYCPGDWSVNAGGRTKLIGTGQRLTSTGFLFTAVISVGDMSGSIDAMSAGYAALGFPFDPATVGSVRVQAPGVRRFEVIRALGDALADALPLGDAGPGFDRQLTRTWDPR